MEIECIEELKGLFALCKKYRRYAWKSAPAHMAMYVLMCVNKDVYCLVHNFIRGKAEKI
jgi:hypothetical protein